MKFAIQCPECHQRLKLSDDLLGRKVRCKCGAIMRLPKSIGGQSSTDGGGDGSTFSHPTAAADPFASSPLPSAEPTASSQPSPAPSDPAVNHEPSAVLNEWEEDLFGDLFSENSVAPQTDPNSSLPSSTSTHASLNPAEQSALPANYANSANPPAQIHPAAAQRETSSPGSREVVMPEEPSSFPTLQPLPAQAPTASAAAAGPPAPATAGNNYSEPAVHPDNQQPSPVPDPRPAPPQAADAFPYQMGNPNTVAAPAPPYSTAAPQQPANLEYPEGYGQQPYYPTRQERESQMLDKYLEEDRWRSNNDNDFMSGLFGTGAGYGIGAGILMMLAGIFLFMTGLFFDVLFCYAPIIFMIGLIGTIVGFIALIVDKTNRRR